MRRRPTGRGAAVTVVCLLLVAGSGAAVVLGGPLVVDRAVRAWSEAHQEPHAFAILDAVTRLFRWQWVCGATLVVSGAVAVVRRTTRPLARALLAMILLIAVTWTLKAAVARPGPTGVPPPAFDGAWPSGHAVTLVTATLVILRLLSTSRAVRPVGVAVALLPAAFVSAALVYCGHHWFTDVAVAFPLGFLIGSTALAVEQGAHRLRPLDREGRRHSRSARTSSGR